MLEQQARKIRVTRASAARRLSSSRYDEPVLFCSDMYHGISHITLYVSRYAYFVFL